MAKIDLSVAAADAAVLHRQDKVVAQTHLEERGRRTEITIDEIKPRPSGDTRALDAMHVLHLAQSIVAVGLLEPLVVDCKGRLIAGGHRLAALRLLHERVPHLRGETIKTLLEASGKKPSVEAMVAATALLPAAPDTDPHPMTAIQSTWPLVPVRMLELDAERDTTAALAAEAAENTQRRDYSRDEIRGLANRLRTAGFVQKRGRPKEGERPLLPALASIVGKHERTILAMLSDDEAARSKKAKPEAAAAQIFARLSKDVIAAKTALEGKRSAVAKRVGAALDELGAAVEAFTATMHQDE